jgi:hypothetical protein
MAPYGVVGTLFARGTVNSAALIALVEGGTFSDLPDLRVVVTAHAVGGVAMASGLSSQSRTSAGAIDVMRKHVFIDTQLVHPALIQASAALLGADRVVAGSDWPIVDDGPLSPALAGVLHQNGALGDRAGAASGKKTVFGSWGSMSNVSKMHAYSRRLSQPSPSRGRDKLKPLTIWRRE